jgi:hypothetical protein
MAEQFNIPVTKEQTINTTNLIIKTFGLGLLKTQIYKPGVATATAEEEQRKNIKNEYLTENIPYFGQDSFKEDETLPQYYSILGTAVFSDLDMDAYKPGYNKIQIPTVLFNVSQKKNIISTSVQGRNGTIKEYISDGDFNIQIKGVLTSKNGIYPNKSVGAYNTIQDLYSYCTLNQSIKINSWYLRQFGIYDIVIVDYNFPQNEGEYAMQPFEITAISDTPFELNITK